MNQHDIITGLRSFHKKYDIAFAYIQAEHGEPKIQCFEYSVMPEYMDGTSPMCSNARHAELENWLDLNVLTNDGSDDVTMLMWINLALLCEKYRDSGLEKATDLFFYDKYLKFSMLAAMYWQLDAIRTVDGLDMAKDCDFSSDIDMEFFKMFTVPSDVLRKTMESAEDLELEYVEEYLPEPEGPGTQEHFERIVRPEYERICEVMNRLAATDDFETVKKDYPEYVAVIEPIQEEFDNRCVNSRWWWDSNLKVCMGRVERWLSEKYGCGLVYYSEDSAKNFRFHYTLLGRLTFFSHEDAEQMLEVKSVEQFRKDYPKADDERLHVLHTDLFKIFTNEMLFARFYNIKSLVEERYMPFIKKSKRLQKQILYHDYSNLDFHNGDPVHKEVTLRGLKKYFPDLVEKWEQQSGCKSDFQIDLSDI